MFGIIYGIIAIWVFFKLMGLMFRATWGLAKCVIGLIFWPIVIAAALMGIMWIALPILIIVGIITSVVVV